MVKWFVKRQRYHDQELDEREALLLVADCLHPHVPLAYPLKHGVLLSVVRLLGASTYR